MTMNGWQRQVVVTCVAIIVAVVLLAVFA